MRFYVSFGQAHAHSINGQTFDKDSLMAVDAPGELMARLGINQLTKGLWCGLYTPENLSEVIHHFPRGVINEIRPVEVVLTDYKTLEDGRLVKQCDGNHGGFRCADPECWNQ